MNSFALERSSRSRQRLVYTVAAVFLVQVVLVVFLSLGERPAPPRNRFETAVSLVAGGPLTAQFEQAAAGNDPTLLALPSVDGFSGPAWLKFEPLGYQPSEYSEPPHWLVLDEHSLGMKFSRFVETNAARLAPNAARPLPPLQRYEPNYPSAAVPSESRLRIDGALNSRSPSGGFPLKSWRHSEILSNTVVRAVVDGDGYTVTATLLRESGFPEADRYALRLAETARWQPLPPHEKRAQESRQLAWGQLTFQWHTSPLLNTNQISSGP